MFFLLNIKGSGMFAGKDGGMGGGMERGGEEVYKLADVNGTFPPLY